MRVVSVLVKLCVGLVSSMTVGCKRGPIILQDYELGLTGVEAQPGAHITLQKHPGGSGSFLEIAYGCDASRMRDVWTELRHQDWREARALSFRIRSDHALSLSVSFMDKNAGFSSRPDIAAAEAWQTVILPFDRFEPNPHSVSEGTKLPDHPDLALVKRLGFAPRECSSRFAVDDFALERR